MDDFGKAEDIMILGLIIVIGYGLYKFSTSFGCVVNQLFGLSGPDCSAPPAGGSYVNAANQVVASPVASTESILGIGSGYPATPDTCSWWDPFCSVPDNYNAGSLATTSSTGSGSGGGGGSAF